jgi:hypothetical protein
MHARSTNKSTQTSNVRRISFESAGALALGNTSGFAVLPAHYIAFAESKRARPWTSSYHFGRHDVKSLATHQFGAYVGIDWRIPGMTFVLAGEKSAGSNDGNCPITARLT